MTKPHAKSRRDMIWDQANDSSGTTLLTTLVRMRQALVDAPLPLETPGVADQRAARSEMIDQLEDYVIPRLMTIEAPLLAVVGGSTGAGKSTLVSSLVGEQVSAPGILRPTTRSPVLVHHPDDEKWFQQVRLLPDLERVDHPTNDPNAIQLVAHRSMPQGLALLDAPDIDSVEESNRELATQLLAAGDLWLFVTSASRYADQVPWEFLRRAAERSTSVAIVLDRTPAEALETVATHLARMLSSRGLRDSPLFTIEECDVDAGGLLPRDQIDPIRLWLMQLAADSAARQAVVKQTVAGAVRMVSRRSYGVADACAEQLEMRQRLEESVEAAYADAIGAVKSASADGTMLRGEVLARWQEFVGAGDFLKSLETNVGRWRDRLINAVRGRHAPDAERVQVAVESGLETLLIEHAERAAERADASWRSTSAGQEMLQRTDGNLARSSRDFRTRAERAVRDWQHAILQMVRDEGADKRSAARFLAYGVNGLGVALMLVAFAYTGGALVGAEAGIAGGSAVVAQKLLEAVFGDQAVRRLTSRAREDLESRVARLYLSEQDRYIELLKTTEPNAEAPEAVRKVAREIDNLRFAALRNAK